MQRMGRTHRSFFRMNAMDSRCPRNGKVIEPLGWYDPCAKDERKRMSLKLDRIKHWIGLGAQPSETVRGLIDKYEDMPAEQDLAPEPAPVAETPVPQPEPEPAPQPVAEQPPAQEAPTAEAPTAEAPTAEIPAEEPETQP